MLVDGNSKPFNELKVRATKNISKGEEVTQCYIDGRFMTSSQMKARLQKDFSIIECKCSVCAGSIPHQDGLISEISSKTASVYSQSFDLLYQKKKKDWMIEALRIERAADLTKQLYVGDISVRFKVYVRFVFASQMARDPIVNSS